MTRIMSNNKETMSLTMDHMKRSSYLRRFTVTALITLLMIVMGSTTASAGVIFKQDYEASGVTADWTSNNTGRYTVAIAGDDSNHYLQVSSVGNGNNGTTVVSSSLNGLVDSNQNEFSMSFDMKLNSGTNATQLTGFTILDGGSGYILKLQCISNGSTTWKINDSSTQTITLDKEKWYSFDISVISKFVLLTVTDKSTGVEVFSRQVITCGITTFGLGNMIFDTAKYWAGMGIDNVKVTTKTLVKQWDFTKLSEKTLTLDTDNKIQSGNVARWNGSNFNRDLYLCTDTEAEGLYLDGDGPWQILSNSRGLYLSKKGDRPFAITGLSKDDVILIKLYDQAITDNVTPKIWGVNNSELLNSGSIYALIVASDGNVAVNLEKYSAVESITILREDRPARVSFSKGNDAEVLGEDPEDVEVQKGTQFATPANTSLYKSGFTLTGWYDGENTIACGDNMSVSEDAMLTAVFTQNNIIRQDITAALEVPFNNIGWTEAGTESYHVTQALFNGESQDVAIKVDGKTITLLDIIPGTKIAVPAGTIADYSATDVTISGDTLVYNGSASSLVITYEGSATSTSIVVKYPRTGKPVVTTDLNDVYVTNVNGELQLSTTFIQADSYQWYSNTTASKEGAVSIANATSATYSVPTNSIGTTFYYCEATNAIGTVSSNIARVAVNDYVTFDFKNWPEDDTEIGNLQEWVDGPDGNRVYQWVEKGYYTADAWAQKWAQQPILYPYALAGYMGVNLGNTGIVNGSGLVQTAKDRPVNVYDLKAGDVIVLTGTGLLEGDIFYPGVEGNATFDTYINSDNTEMTLLVKTDGMLSFMVCAAKSGTREANSVYTLKVPNKYAPTITTDLDGQSYTLSRSETKTLTVAATANDANPLRYQWYRNDVDSNKGGRAIDGANSATYTTVEGESYYYYCVVFNSVTGAAAATTKTTHVQCKPQVSYVNNDAEVIGDVPATEVIEIGEKFTIESRNYQLLKPGYTLTGWTDGTNTYEFGKSYDIVNDIVLNPVFRANEQTISAITKVTTFTWPFATSKDAPSVNWTDGETHVLAAQQAVTGELQDFGAKVVSTGFATGAAAATVAEGTTIKIPMKYGTTIELFTSGETPSATVLTTDLVTPRNMTADGSTLTYIYKGGNDELTMTLGAGAYDSLRVHYVPTGMPVFAKDLEANYYLETGQDSTLTVEATEGVTFQWYRNTTHSNEGGTKIEGATSASYKVGSTTDKSEYYYVTISNNYGTVASVAAQVDYSSYVTLDFVNWDVNDAKVYALDGKWDINMRGGATACRYFYPYGLAGNLAVQGEGQRMRTDTGQRYFYNFDSGGRYIGILGMKKGQKIIINSEANALWLWPDGNKNNDANLHIDSSASYLVEQNDNASQTTLTILNNGNAFLSLNRNMRIYSIILPTKYQPIITKDLEETYVVDKDEALTLSVEAELSAQMEGHSLAYQWYSNTSNSNKGGTAIEGATSADYTIEKVNKSAYYYCLVSNTATGAITPSSPAAVGFYLNVVFTNNDADAYGEAPKAVKVQSGLPVTMPKNQTLIKDGYTLTGWTDYVTSTAIGEDYIPQNDVILNPVFTKNADNVSLQKRSEEMTVRWVFATENGSAEYNNNASANVLQPIINGDAVDVGIKMTKGDNQTNEVMASNGWMAANNGNFTLPVVKGARIALTVYYPTDITINGENITYNATYGEQGAVRYVYAYTGSEKEIALNIANNYIKDLEIYYPAPELLSTNAATYNVYIDNAKVARKSAVITLTGKNLEPGSTVTLTKDAKASNITIDSETFTVGSDGTLSQQILVTYEGTAAQAQDNTVLTFVYSEDTKATATVTYGREAAFTGASDVTPVSIKTVWDWSNTASIINPAQDVYMAFNDIELGEGQAWPEGFTAANLAGSGTYYANNISKCFEGKELYFKTRCKGTIDVEFSAASGNNITLAVNGENTSFSSNSTNSVTAKKIPVGVGGVLLQAHTTGLTTGEQDMRIYKVTFTPDANKPVITLDKTTSSFTLDPSEDVNYPDGDPSEVLYYTTDGSEPSLTSESTKKYMGEPVSLYTNVMIKAMAVAPNKNNSDVDSLQTDMRTYKLNIGVYPANSGRVIATPMAENYEYTENATVTLKAEAASGYGLSAWATSRANIANEEFIHTGESSITVNVNTTSNEYWAVFENGETVTVIYDFSNCKFLENDGQESDLSEDYQEAFDDGGYDISHFKSPITSNSIFVPKNYPVFVGFGYGTTNRVDEGSMFTLLYWEDQNGKRYEKGSNTVVNEANQTYTLRPVFQNNPGMEPLEERTSSYNITWDFRHSEYAHPLTLPAGVTSFYTRDAVMSYQENTTQFENQTVDIAIQIDTRGVTNTDGSFAEKAFTNEDDDEWASISKGTKITIPSSYGAKITLATYKPIIAGEGGTKINGIAPDNVYEENVQRDGEAYLYTWTIKDNATSVVLTIGDLDYAFYKYIHAEYPNTETTYFKLSSNNDVMGTVSAVNTVDENDHGTVSDLGLGFNRNSSVTLTAERSRFYELKYWITGKGTKFFPDGTYQRSTDDSPKPIGSSVNSDDITFTHVDENTVEFTLKRYFEIQAVFGPRESYTINFMSGISSLAEGDALPVQRVEIGEKFDMPANNYNLYKEGYTLQYYISADSVDNPSARHYEFGKSYSVSNDMLLMPIFTANTKSVYDVADENGRTVTWNVNQMKFNFNSSNGRMVSQLAVDDDNTIDVQCYFANRSNNVYYRINSSGVLELSSAANLQILSTSDCKFTVNAAAPAEFQKGSITIASDATLQGASVSKDITTTSNGQSIVFNSPATVQSISVKYNKIEKPRNLASVKVGETSLTEEQVATLNSTTTLTYDCAASDIYAAQGAMPTVTAEALIADAEKDKGVVDVTQATVDNPVATLYLRYKVSDTDKITLRTFTINFNITSKEAPVLVSAKVNDSDVEGGNVTEAQNTSGVICLAFDHPMVAKNVVINDKTFTATAVGDTVKLHYWALSPSTSYDFTIPANTFEDIYGAKCTTPISLSFTTAASASVPATLFNYIVTHKIVWDSFTQEMKDTVQIVPDDVIENLAKKDNIEYGTLEEGLAKANAAGGAARYRIFVPDGEYNVRGISPLVSTDVTGNLWGKDLNGTPTQTVGLTMTDYKDHVFYNGRSILSSNNISIIGQSQDSTIIYSDPRVCGLYRSPIFSISNNVKGTYMQDFTLENRFCNSMGNQPDAYLITHEKEETGGAPSIVDNGYHTVAKYVTLKAHDGTYVSSPAKEQQTDNYYEDCQLWGMHYLLLRTGQTWWQNPKVVLRYSSKRAARLSCIEHFSTQPWGYILKDGVFTAENAAARSKNENGFCLGTLVRYSPVQTLLNMKFDVASAAVGYNVRVQGGGEVIRFHEYGSVSAAGVPVDLSTRSTSIFSPGAGSDDYVLTASQAAEYTIENMFGSGEAYDPRVHTAQVDLDDVVLSQTDEGITWNGKSQAICYFIFRQNPETGFFEFFDICLNDVYTPRDEADADGMVFYVRAANERGGLGKPSKTIKYKKLGWYDLKVVHKEGLAETGDTSDDWKGWSTICLARNAKVPAQSINEDGTEGGGHITVYGAQQNIDGTTIHMKKVSYLRAGMGYVVYATTGETEKTYRFNYTWDTNNISTGAHDSFLDGNELDDTVSVGTVNCYTMAYKKTINPDCVGFYKFIGEKIPPHRAYLTVETAAAKGFILDTEADAKKVRFVFDDSDDEFFFYEGDEDADGIRNVRSSEVDPEAVFDLSGKRLDKSQLRKGMVYVIGGKKVLWTGE